MWAKVVNIIIRFPLEGPDPGRSAIPPRRAIPELSIVFRGNHPATVDDKGRLKLPRAFLAPLIHRHGRKLFVTSLDGESVSIYPLPVWEEIETRLEARGDLDAAKRRFLLRVNYYGQETEIAAHGRILIPQRLRAQAGATRSVDVLGKGRCLEAWDHDKLLARIEADPPSDADHALLAELGV